MQCYSCSGKANETISRAVVKLLEVTDEGSTGTSLRDLDDNDNIKSQCMAMHMPTNDSQPGYDDLVGDCSETIAVVDHITTCVLLDTGSMVTTISKSIVQSHFSGLPTYPICDILQVKGPLDEKLPYNEL